MIIQINYLNVEYDSKTMNIVNIHNIEINKEQIINITKKNKIYKKKLKIK